MAQPGRSAIFLDRDGTLMVDTGYPRHPDEVRILPGVCEALRQFQALGYALVIISNQAGVPRGIMTRDDVAAVHARLEEYLAEGGVRLDAAYYCYDPPDSGSLFRKPASGMLLQARDDLDLQLDGSFMIGDKALDMEAGRNAGCRTILYHPDSYPPVATDQAWAVAASWSEIHDLIARGSAA